MTIRELQIIGAILNCLHALDSGQADELEIHKRLLHTLDPNASVAELRAALRECDAKGYILGVPARLTGRMKWNITDRGEATRLELNE